MERGAIGKGRNMGRGQRGGGKGERGGERGAIGKGGTWKGGNGEGGKGERGGDGEGEKKEQEEQRFHRWI